MEGRVEGMGHCGKQCLSVRKKDQTEGEEKKGRLRKQEESWPVTYTSSSPMRSLELVGLTKIFGLHPGEAKVKAEERGGLQHDQSNNGSDGVS